MEVICGWNVFTINGSHIQVNIVHRLTTSVMFVEKEEKNMFNIW